MMSKQGNARENQPALLPIHGMGDKKPRSLDRDATIIGRARGCDIGLEAPDVSNLHCVISRMGPGFRIRDCGSRAGTKINGEMVRAADLHDGDILLVGPFSFTVQIPCEERASAKVFSQHDLEHLQNSRRHLAQLALAIRRRLSKFQEKGLCLTPTDLSRKAAGLKNQIRAYDQRLNLLEEAERELTEDRETLQRDKEVHQTHVQQVEREMVSRLEEVEQQVRNRWQEFQQRVRQEEQKLAEDIRKVKDQEKSRVSVDDLQDQKRQLDQLARELQEEKERLARDRQQLAQDLENNGLQKQEMLAMQELLNGQKARIQADQAQLDSSMQRQQQELLRMMAELKKMHNAIRQQQAGSSPALAKENEQLRARVHELEELLVAQPEPSQDPHSAQELADLREENKILHQLVEAKNDLDQEAVASGAQLVKVREENERLNLLLQEKDQALQALQQKPATSNKRSPNETDLESYEAELNQFRQELEQDRAKLKIEIEQLRQRNAEMDEAVRDMEMEMSRERAELARERMRLDRMREEVRQDVERMHREGPVRESLAQVNKLREEMAKGKAGNGLNDRLKSLRGKLTE